MKCQTCSHPQREAIDTALLAENHTFAALSEKYGLSVSSLFRHQQHLAEKMRRASQRLQESQDQVSLLKLNAFLDHVQRAVQAAELEGNIDRVLKGSQIASRIIRQISQMDVPLSLDTVYRLISSPRFVTTDSLLPTGPEIITGIHQSIAEAAFFPCPDEEPESLETIEADNAVKNQEAPPASCPGNQEPETLNSELETQNLLQELLTHLLTAETNPKTKREKTAKKPEKSPSFAENISINQSDNCSEKSLAKNPTVGRENQAPPAVRKPASFDTDKDYEEYLQQKAAAEKQLLATPQAPVPGPPSEPEPPKPRKQFLHPIEDAEEYNYAITHGHRREDRPAHIPDRRWHEDFGNPRKIKGTY